MGSREKMTGYVDKRASLEAARAETDMCRSRIGQLLDSESFVELDSLVTARGLTFGAERPKVPGDGVVTGYGTLEGRLVNVAAQDPTVYGGSIVQMHAEKISKAIQMAVDAQVPFIGLYETGGVRIEEGILGLEGLGSLLASINDASGQIPLIAAVFGPNAGGAAFAAANSDFVLMTEKAGVFMNGPMVVSATEGKTLDIKEIGGAAVHAEKTGLAMLTAADDNALIQKIRQLMNYIPDSCVGFLEVPDPEDDPNRTDVNLDELASAIDEGYDMLDILQAVVDQDSFFELSSGFASGLITGFARLGGHTVGLLANRSVRMDKYMTQKAIRFAAVCERLNIPLITWVDSEGYIISLEAEQQGLVQDAAGLMRALSQMTVPRISVIVGKAIGTAYLTLSAKSSGSDLVYAWPTASVAVVNPDTAAHIIYRKEMAASKNPINERAEFVARYDEEIANPYVAASLGHVDEVILPSATRPRLISALDLLMTVY